MLRNRPSQGQWEEQVMNAFVENEAADRPIDVPSMYAPRWARDAATEASEVALVAAKTLRRALPPASLLTEPEKPPRRERAFEGDIAVRQLRERPSLDPVAVPAPPVRAPSRVSVLARAAGAVGIAALAAFFMVGTAPLSLAVKADDEASASFWSRFVFPTGNRQQPAQNAAVRLAAADSAAVTLAAAEAARAPIVERAEPAVQATSEPVAAPAPNLRPLDREEIALLIKRSEDLIGQGDIAAARLMLTRAAEAGDVRAALALGSTYDSGVLRKLGVLGVAADAAQAREWYERAAQSGSGEATRRLEQFAQSAR
jgi:hypothetical protein